MTANNCTPHLPEDYDAQVRRTIPYYDAMHQETINLARSLSRPPSRWLDTGCGTGLMVQRALRVLPETRFMLADPSSPMLDLARERLKGEGRVRFLGSLRTQDLLGEVKEAPDIITAVQCHHYLSREERALAEQVCYNLLPPGGVFVTFENVRPLTGVGTVIGKRNWGIFQSEHGKTPAEVEAHLARFDREYFPITIEEHLEMLRRTGFSSVELLWCSYMQAGFYGIKQRFHAP